MKAPDTQSDVYAFGIMLYEMLSGSRPFAEETLATLVYKHLNEPLPMIDHTALNLPPAFNSIIQRATAKDPGERYEDALVAGDGVSGGAAPMGRPRWSSSWKSLTSPNLN